jgi:outer membrane protein OmpA-like peptidoglycan-associated protein
LSIAALFFILVTSSCTKKRVAAVPAPPAAPAPRQNVFALLPDPEGKPTGIVVRNAAGVQDVSQPGQAVRVERSDVAPGAPFTLDQAELRRLFGSALDTLPAPEVVFILHFNEGSDLLNAESQAQLPAILTAIRERRSTAITVTGHTDTTGDARSNYQLGLRRAQGVESILAAQGVDSSYVFASSHGEADPLVPTARGVAEARNRRVEVIVR